MLMPGLKLTMDAIVANGYEVTSSSLARGYVSRKTTIFEIKEAGGRRKGQLYIEVPHMKSTQYHWREYLTYKGGQKK